MLFSASKPKNVQSAVIATETEDRTISKWLPVMAFCTMLFVAWGSIWLTRESDSIAAIWPVNALIISMILLSGRQNRWAIFLAAYAGNVAANTFSGDSLSIALSLSACNSVEIFIVTAVLTRLRPRIDFTVLRDLMFFALVAGVIAPAVSSLLAAGSLHLFADADFLGSTITWYPANALGLLVFMPLVMTAFSQNVPQRDFTSLIASQKALYLFGNIGLALVVFSQVQSPLLFLMMPGIFLTALKCGPAGAVVSNLSMTVIAITFSQFDQGPIAMIQGSEHMKMATLQVFLASCVFFSLIASAYLTERSHYENDLKKAKALSDRATESMSSFLSTVSHELRTPMTSIRGSLSLLVASSQDNLDPKAANLLRIAHRNSERLVILINDILDMEKIESGKMSFDMADQPLREIIDDAMLNANNYRPDAMIKLVLTDNAPGAIVHVDSSRLQQVVANLLSNAIKFSPEGGTVQVGLRFVDDWVRISVSDSGKGIPAEFQNRIFKKFEQADPSNTRGTSGSGLGLSIAKSLTEKMQGKIFFETREGEGATFFVDLPVVARDAESPHPAAQSLSSARVLVCEPDPGVASQVAARLCEDGYVADLAPDLATMQMLLRSRSYAALAFDRAQVNDQASDMIKALLAQSDSKNAPIILFSQDAQGDDAEQKSRNINWLTQPVDLDGLCAAVRTTIGDPDLCRPQILHVEDDADILAIMAESCGAHAKIVAARTVEAARQQLSERHFDLVILDVSLPDGKGYDLLGVIAENIPVIVFSGAEMRGQVPSQIKAVMSKGRNTEAEVMRSVRNLLLPSERSAQVK